MDKPAERVIRADPDAWCGGDRARIGEEAWQDYQRAIHDPATVHAMCEDYRAGLGIDRAHDDDDRRSGRRLACPTLVLWASQDDMEDLYGDVLGAGVRGPMTSAATRSTAAITWPRRLLRTCHPRCALSSRRTRPDCPVRAWLYC